MAARLVLQLDVVYYKSISFFRAIHFGLLFLLYSGKLKWFDYVFMLICKIISLILCEIAILEIASF